MHKLVLSGIAALAVLAIATGGRGEPAGFGQANGMAMLPHSVQAPLAWSLPRGFGPG